MKAKIWVLLNIILVLGCLSVIAINVVNVDPFFHYHAPHVDDYYYNLNNQRSQNDGISKYFEYNAIITGTSMTENFKTSEMDEIFGTYSIKVPYSGGTYKEINDNLKNALAHNPNLKIVVRGLDMGRFIAKSDAMREDLGEYPTYLYDDNIFNDVQYVFNRDVIFKRTLPMLIARYDEDFSPGITSFDAYSNWMGKVTFGFEAACPNGISNQEPGEPVHLSDDEKDLISENIYYNVTSLAEAYPDVMFYYFMPPFSALQWLEYLNSGTIYKLVEAERNVVEAILQVENIKLYSFNNRTDITTDLNNYKDGTHYASWINSLILRWMYDEQYLLTWDNYEEYLDEELSFYTSYDYSQLSNQIDYENDFYAEALLNEELNGVAPVKYTKEMLAEGELCCANVVLDQNDGTAGVECLGLVQIEAESDVSISDYLYNTEYVGLKLLVDDISDYKYLVFYGGKKSGHGQPGGVYIYDEMGDKLAEIKIKYQDLDNEMHQYMIDVSHIEGAVTIVFNGGYTDSMENETSSFLFNGITLY